MTGSPGNTAQSPVIVDTNVVSCLFKGDTRVQPYLRHLANHLPVLSFMTVAELDAWTELRNWGAARRERLEQFLLNYVVHYPDRRLCRLWATVTADSQRAGRRILPADAWIAATALLYSVPLLTHNASDYVGVSGLIVISEPGP
jgi:tRNA(fMet)-specific endonuclease VapC